MKDSMYELKEMLCKEIDKIADKGEISAGSLDAIDKLTHSIKSIVTIMAMEGSSGDDYSGARRGGRRGYSRDDGMDELSDHLHSMLSDARSEDQKQMIRKWLRQVEK